MKLSLPVLSGPPKVRPQKKPIGIILWRGPSAMDGGPISAVATGIGRESKNRKTGNQIQVYLFRRDMNPLWALGTGKDSSICGDCIHRNGSCYVEVGRGVAAVYKAFKAGSYLQLNKKKHAKYFEGRSIRLGAYGDFAAIPRDVGLPLVQWLTSTCENWTGYTHQWRKHFSWWLQPYCMASVESEEEAQIAWSMGWRTFRIRTKHEEVLKGEFICPASEEAGRVRTCSTCRACSGTKAGGRNVSPVIVAHGMPWKMRRFEKMKEATDENVVATMD